MAYQVSAKTWGLHKGREEGRANVGGVQKGAIRRASPPRHPKRGVMHKPSPQGSEGVSVLQGSR